MSKCGKCTKAPKAGTNVIDCKKCKNIFHLTCVNLKLEDLDFIKENSQSWYCFKCVPIMKADNSRDGTPASPAVRQRSFDTAVDLSELSAKIDSILQQNDLILGQNKEIKATIGQLHADFEEITKQVALLSNSVKDLTERVESVESENSSLKSRLSAAEGRINIMEQNNLLTTNTIEIRGVPIRSNEDPEQIVVNMSKAFHMNLSSTDISAAYRVGKGFGRRNEDPPPPILVRFARRRVRDDFLKGRKVRRDMTTRELGWNDNETHAIYVNEALSRVNKLLYNKAKELKRLNKLKFLWVQEGRVLVKKAEGHSVVHVVSDESLKNF